ncbi:RagB/SusD family nutrient uptake outer membrane protein, partial [uncultured Flavobacterium sp.]|uniref:RagB/SusD family nutrient uptake outer membrane protein n=1 Tax=uncultured Flavobacterium sp. TaxID=165435 RepID=UPI0025E50FD0
ITQPSELPPDMVYETVNDMQAGLFGVYSSVPGENNILFTSIFTDEVAIGIGNGGQGQDGELAFLLNANSGDAASIWLSNYSLINAANRLINGVENVVISTDEENDETAWYNHILAQAHALRAWGHFQLLTYFSEDMTNDGSLGVIVMDFAPDGDDIYVQLPRNTTGEVFSFINSDLDFAEANLSELNPQPGDNFEAPFTNTFVTINMIRAFKARMAAYRGDYATAKTFVDQLDTTGGFTGTGYNLTNKINYPAIWTDSEPSAQSEVIWKLERRNPGGNATGNFSQFWASRNSSVSGSAFFEVNRALFNLVNFPNDVRQKVIVDVTAFPDPSTGTSGTILPNYTEVTDYEYETQDILPVGKYTRTENLELLADVKVFRFSEMVLIRAEYYASIGDVANAIAQVNLVRAARYGNASGNISNPSSYTVQQAWAFILRERRIELAFEGHRYVDLRRLGTLAGQGVDRDPRDCEFNGFCTLPADDYRFILPIPRAETAANPNLAQNTGY